MRINSGSGGCTWMSSISWRGYCTASYLPAPGFPARSLPCLYLCRRRQRRSFGPKIYAENSDGIEHGCHTWLPECSSGDSSAEARAPTMPADPWSSSPPRGAGRLLTLPPRIPTPFADTLSTGLTTTRSPPWLMSSSEYWKGLTHNEIRAQVVKYMETLLTQARTLVRKAH